MHGEDLLQYVATRYTLVSENFAGSPVAHPFLLWLPNPHATLYQCGGAWS
jgi:hypothetical protein